MKIRSILKSQKPIKSRKAAADRRFGGVERVYGKQALQQFNNAHICIIGLGGVGSWVVEGLVRSGIGELTLVDMDHVSESNINRQLQATDETLGMAKTEALSRRITAINPGCQINIIEDFISRENQSKILNNGYHWVVDCIDDFRIKASLTHYCRSNKIKLLTIGGAGGMTDPARIKMSDLSKSYKDPLLSQTRRLLRQNHSFPTNPIRSFGIPCVFSDEEILYPDGNGGVTHTKSKGAAAEGLNCAGGFGSSVAVTASFGFAASSYILKRLAQ